MASIWLTGASSGIGEALARELVRRGGRVAAFARRKERLDRLRDELGESLLVQVGDVTDRVRVKEAVAEAQEAFGPIDVAIFNAGIGDSLMFDEFDVDLIERTFAVNVMGVVYGMDAVLPQMKERKSGTIVGISSPAGFRGLPTSGAYCASKAALSTLLESLRVEARAHGIKLLTVSPGFVKSEMTDRNDHPMPFLMETDKAARIICDGIESGRRHIHFPWRLTVPLLLMRMLPIPLWDYLMRKFVVPRAKPKRKSES